LRDSGFQFVEITAWVNQSALVRLRAPKQRAILLQRRDGNDRGL
jgi:hypothetical protein